MHLVIENIARQNSLKLIQNESEVSQDFIGILFISLVSLFLYSLV